MVRNSLTETKEIFTPAEGNIVRIYVCGPTVYSVSHMGHARTFLCFDILRRILEKYFRFNVLFQMNITDIDDKIILSARKNELLRQFREEKHSAEFIAKKLEGLVSEEEAKLECRKQKLTMEKPQESSREYAEYETQLKQIELKIEQLADVKAKLEFAKLNPSSHAHALIDIGKDLLMNSLDADKGSSVSDKSVFEAHSRYYENEFLKDCQALGVREPDVMTRVTEYVPEIVAFVEQIQENGFAYESNGSVYFDTQKFRSVQEYPKLVPHAGSAGATDAEIAEGEGALAGGLEEKRHRNDFALWKKSKSGEPVWESPWGPGRPGWHIECSVMASAIHGPVLDVHGGGVDLKFPHHDNEIAQTEAHYKTDQWVNYFLHAGHLHIKGLKMAKSLKNFITIREALTKFSAKQIRIMFLLQQWDRPVNFSDQTLSEAREKEGRINSFFARVDQVGRNMPIATSPQKWNATDKNLAETILEAQEKVHASLCDNFDTPSAMDALERCIGAVNQYLLDQNEVPKYPLLLRAKDFVSSILSVFGVIDEVNIAKPDDQLNEMVKQFVSVRDTIREIAASGKNPDLMALSDQLRDEVFVNLGIRVVDGTKGTETWSLANPEELRREYEVRQEEKRAKETAKLENKRAIIEKELSKWMRHSQDKSIQETLFSEYNEFDGEGVPMHPDLSASKRKAMKKDLDKFIKERSEFESKGGLEFLEKLKAELADLVQKMK